MSSRTRCFRLHQREREIVQSCSKSGKLDIYENYYETIQLITISFHSMISLETSPESTSRMHAWRCLLYGDVFEVTNFNNNRPPTWTIAPGGSSESVQLSHPPPMNHSYRQLNDNSAEATVDIMGESAFRASRFGYSLLTISSSPRCRGQSVP